MAGGTTNLVEHLLAALHSGIVQIACGRHSETTVPYHEVVVVLVAHFWLTEGGGVVVTSLSGVVHTEQGEHFLCNTFIGVSIVRMYKR